MKEIAEFVSDDGILERRVPQGGWSAPSSVVLDDSEKWLLWGALKKGRPWTTIKYPKEGILEEFIGLADAEPKDFLRYARKWGVLMRCKHDLSNGLETYGILPHENTCRRCHKLFWNWAENREAYPLPCEPLSLWRKYSLELRAIIRVAGMLRLNQKGRDEDWELLLKPFKKYNFKRRKIDLTLIIQNWARKARLRIMFEWDDYRDPCLTLGGGLLPSLALQMILAVSRTDAIVLCNFCGKPYFPKRTPNPNRRSYCSDCGIKAAWRDAQRERRKKLRSEKSTVLSETRPRRK